MMATIQGNQSLLEENETVLSGLDTDPTTHCSPFQFCEAAEFTRQKGVQTWSDLGISLRPAQKPNRRDADQSRRLA